jgi:hypothetical protein
MAKIIGSTWPYADVRDRLLSGNPALFLQFLLHKCVRDNNAAYNRLSLLDNRKSPMLEKWLRGSTYIGCKNAYAFRRCLIV